ncbi:MAG TPA: SurA N-terminal domain-containing protein [Halanaerobiales bacterium]|nr:SurA N-terminal domain-containing protein [Halanaerobiales bacterium]
MFDNLRNNSKIIVYIVVAAFIVTGGLMGFGSYMSRNNTGGGNRSSQYIARVNDKGITPQQFLSVLRNSASQANNLSQSEVIPFRLNVLKSMIEREILLTEAENQNINVEITDEEVEKRIDEILKQNDMTREELKSNLESQDYTYEQFKTDIRNSLKNSEKITKVKESTYSNIEVTEEEIQQAYQERYSDGEDKPELEEVKSDIRESILTTKQNEAYQNWLENKKADANVTINDPVLYAYNALDKGNYQVAIDSFENLANSDNTSASIYTYLAQAYAGSGNHEKALETFNTALEEYPENWELRLNFGDYHANQDNKEKAIGQYNKASELAGENFYAHYKLFMAFNNIGASKEAEEEMQTITKIQQNMQSQQQQQEEQPEDASSIEEEIEKTKPENNN